MDAVGAVLLWLLLVAGFAYLGVYLIRVIARSAMKRSEDGTSSEITALRLEVAELRRAVEMRQESNDG